MYCSSAALFFLFFSFADIPSDLAAFGGNTKAFLRGFFYLPSLHTHKRQKKLTVWSTPGKFLSPFRSLFSFLFSRFPCSPFLDPGSTPVYSSRTKQVRFVCQNHHSINSSRNKGLPSQHHPFFPPRCKPRKWIVGLHGWGGSPPQGTLFTFFVTFGGESQNTIFCRIDLCLRIYVHSETDVCL